MLNSTAPLMIDGFAVWTSGTGPVVVLLHANGGNHCDFEAIVDRLAQEHTVHAIDWPGHGASTSGVERSAVAFARALPAVLEQLPGAPFVVLGNSVGGFAAIHAAATEPKFIRALILVAPGGFSPRWLGTRLACRLISSGPVAPRAMRLLPQLYLRRRTDAVRAIRERAVLASQDASAATTFGSIWRSFNSPDHEATAAAAAVKVPVLLTWGRRDPVLPWTIDGRRARRAFPTATVATFPCGHQPFAEMPNEFMLEVDHFLRTLTP